MTTNAFILCRFSELTVKRRVVLRDQYISETKLGVFDDYKLTQPFIDWLGIKLT